MLNKMKSGLRMGFKVLFQGLSGPISNMFSIFTDFSKFIYTLTIWSVSGFIMIVGYTLYGVYESEGYETVEKPYETYQLVNLDGSKDINGKYSQTFFVGSGYIDESLYYHFFYETSKGLKYEKINAGSYFPEVYIIETDGPPRYVKYGNFYSDPNKRFAHDDMLGVTRNVLYIPKGTIKRGYKINED